VRIRLMLKRLMDCGFYILSSQGLRDSGGMEASHKEVIGTRGQERCGGIGSDTSSMPVDIRYYARVGGWEILGQRKNI
jgi:hypothetical protein